MRRLADLIALANPLVLASGPLGRNADLLIKHAAVAGGVVAKSATWDPQAGNPPPRVARFGEYGLLNWEDLPNPGYAAFAGELRRAKAGCGQVPLIASIGPLEDLDQQTTIARTFEAAGVDAIELDFKWGARVRGNLLGRITEAVKAAVRVPVIAKLAPFQGDIVEAAREVSAAGADAICAINSLFPAMVIDVRRRAPALSVGHGGLSGAPLLPLAVSAIYRIYEAVDVPIIGSGGVISGEDALQLIMAGAQAVQMCTVVMRDGPSAFTRINGELAALLAELGFTSLEDAVGIAHRAPLHIPHSATAGER
ncbi:MAG TPA: dihydroorotate dehydrogenase [Anaerolineae bacterium]